MNTQPSTASAREQRRIREEEGLLPPGATRRKAAEAQDASFHADDAPVDPGRSDAEKVATDRNKDGPSDPAARGRDAPVDVR
ncbi:MAG: hypothetical protein EOP81_14925 [Variovorax sp.]|nr:MAG: hypothetical protein EOP81_14925 [Variovorax sp.]